ncbi:MAG: helix-turn-helix transcriptional regulator, partial [Chloroflexota bacterium]
TRHLDMEAIEGELDILRRQVKAYQRIKDGKTRELTVSFHELGGMFALMRVASGLTQKQLAQELGLKEQQIQRYEANKYAHASLARMQEVIAMLDCNLIVDVPLPRNSKATSEPHDAPRLTVAPPTSVTPSQSWEGAIYTNPTSFEYGVQEPSKGATAVLAAR